MDLTNILNFFRIIQRIYIQKDDVNISFSWLVATYSTLLHPSRYSYMIHFSCFLRSFIHKFSSSFVGFHIHFSSSFAFFSSTVKIPIPLSCDGMETILYIFVNGDYQVIGSRRKEFVQQFVVILFFLFFFSHHQIFKDSCFNNQILLGY